MFQGTQCCTRSAQPVHSTEHAVLLKPDPARGHVPGTHVSTVISVLQAQRALPVVFHVRRWVQLRTVLSASVRALQLKERTLFTLESQGGSKSPGQTVSKQTGLQSPAAVAQRGKAQPLLWERGQVQTCSGPKLRTTTSVTASERQQVTEVSEVLQPRTEPLSRSLY